MKRFFLLLLALACSAGAASAEFLIEQLPDPESSCAGPVVASSDNGLTMVAYIANGPLTMSFAVTRLVPTHPQEGVPWPEPVTLGAGGSVRLCWSHDGFTAAVTDGLVIQLFHSDTEGNWDPEPTYIWPGSDVMSMDLWGVPSDAAGPNAFLTWSTTSDPYYQGGTVHFSGRTVFGWTPDEVVAESPEQLPRPQVTWGIGPAGPVPTIYYLGGIAGSPELMVTTRLVDTGWTEPQAVPGSELGAEFDALHPFDLSRHLLGNGPPPVCPCNIMSHQYFESGLGWQDPDNIHVDYGYLNWPMSPNLAAETDGKVHAFWTQRNYLPDLTPGNCTLEYWTFNEGVWTDAGDFLAAHDVRNLGWRVALDVSPDNWPVLAWTRTDTIEGVPYPEQVWIARPLAPSAAPEIPQRELALKAWPNPFNPLVELEFELAAEGPARLEIFDARGRLLARLTDGVQPAGRNVFTWKGRDLSGRALPSGVYFARLVAERGNAVQKIVLAR